jgi:putative flippase GtrA
VRRWWPPRPGRVLRHEPVRFLLVGGCGELVYLALFALVNSSGGSAVSAIAVAGTLSMLLNAVLHARISFRVRFRLRLLLAYLAIQLLCLAVSLVVGRGLESGGAGPTHVALITMLLWAALSFLLTRWNYLRPQGEAAGLGSRQTSQPPL